MTAFVILAISPLTNSFVVNENLPNPNIPPEEGSTKKVCQREVKNLSPHLSFACVFWGAEIEKTFIDVYTNAVKKK